MKTGPPMVVDFREEVVQKAVQGMIVQHPATIYPASISVPLGLAVVLLKWPFWVFLLSIAGVGIGIGAWIVNTFFRHQRFENSYTRALSEAITRNSENKTVFLMETLNQFGAQRAVEQMAELRAKRDNLKGILRLKFQEGELAFGRYLGWAEQVYLACLDNLEDVASMLDSVSEIEPDVLQRRLAVLKGDKEPDENQKLEIDSLKSRLGLYDKAQADVRKFLAQNEAAMTRIDTTAAAIGATRMSRGEAVTSLDVAMEELAELTERVTILDMRRKSDAS